eukprot:NODE_11_length_46995_cov_0.451872.p7 type:complete len:671 gc:universal NODE_11_length_46995_cov_0.451872:26851-24839(-)
MNPYHFPYIPYDLQLEVMDFVYNAIKDDKIVVVESPTGTGKSLMLLCTTWTWFQEQAPKKPSWMTKKQRITNNSYGFLKHKELGHDWQDLLSNPNYEVSDSRPYKPKLIYCTRTHSQIQSIVKELRKTSFGPSCKISVLASRKQYCVNPKCENMSASQLSETCKDLIGNSDCKYFNESIDSFVDEFQTKIWDIEDAVSNGKSHVFCPYFMSKISVNEADIIIAPFQSILNENTRNILNIKLRNCIVVIDEAHSFYDAALSSECVSADFLNLTKLLDIVKLYKSKYNLRLSASNLTNIELFVRILKALHKLSSMPELSDTSIITVLVAIQLDQINLYEIADYLVANHFNIKLSPLFKEYDLPSQFYFNIIHLIRLLMSDSKNGCLFISSTELQYLKTSTKDTISELADQCKSLIFAAGTLSPMQQYIDTMIPAKLRSKVAMHQAPHIVDKSNFRVQTVGQFRYDSVSTNVAGILNTCSSITSKAPNKTGILIFVSSFKLLEDLMLKIKHYDNTLLKSALFESQKSSNVKDLLAKHSSKLKHSCSVVFAVFGGKLSEGIDFKDDLARTLILFGIPFPNMESMEFKKRCRDNNTFDVGLSVAIRSVNQAIGRCLRHKNDYAFVFLCDSRYSLYSRGPYFDKIINQLSLWIQPNVEHLRQLDLQEYIKFFKNKE